MCKKRFRQQLASFVLFGAALVFVAPVFSYRYLAVVPHAYCPLHLRFEALQDAGPFSGTAGFPQADLKHDDYTGFFLFFNSPDVNPAGASFETVLPQVRMLSQHHVDIPRRSICLHDAPKHSPPVFPV